MGDIFALQDELTERIIAVLSIKMGEEEHKRLAARGTRNLGAYDLFLRGLEYFNQYTKEANVQARMMFKNALDLDPGYAMASEKMGWTHFIDWTIQHREDENRFLSWHCGNAPVTLAANPAKTALRTRMDMTGTIPAAEGDAMAGLSGEGFWVSIPAGVFEVG